MYFIIQFIDEVYDKHNLRLTVEAMLYRMRVDCPWRDLMLVQPAIPAHFCDLASKGSLEKGFRKPSKAMDGFRERHGCV